MSFFHLRYLKEKIHVTLAIDAFAFKKVGEKMILQKYPTLNTIATKNVYNNLFVFNIQPININVKPFPIHIELKKMGQFLNIYLHVLKP